MPNIIRKRAIFLSLSAVLVVLSIVALAVFGLKPGIDFSAGSILTVAFDNKPTATDLKSEMATLGYSNVEVQTTGSGDFLIRISTADISTTAKNTLLAGLQSKFGTTTERGFESIDPVIARQSTRVAAEAVGLSAFGILAYLTWAFRKMPRPLHYGTCAVIAILHDVLVVLGIFAVLSAIFGWEIDLVFLIGVMTVIGYSTNNTVVVFDRIRENVLRGVAPTFEGAVNRSVVETIVRSVNSSMTTTIAGLALMLFVGAAIQNLAVVMIIGIVVGTYDSLFVAPAILVIWDNFDKRRLASQVSRAGT